MVQNITEQVSLSGGHIHHALRGTGTVRQRVPVARLSVSLSGSDASGRVAGRHVAAGPEAGIEERGRPDEAIPPIMPAPTGDGGRSLVEALLDYAKALTASRAFAHYYVEMAIAEFVAHGGTFAGAFDGNPAMRHRLYEAFHRVWCGAQAVTQGACGAGRDDAHRRAARLLAEREGLGAAEIAGILNRSLESVSAWTRDWAGGQAAVQRSSRPIVFADTDLPGRLWPELAAVAAPERPTSAGRR